MLRKRSLRIFGLLALSISISGCATSTLNDPQAATRQRLVQGAEQLIGTPYVFGGESKAGMDCSGLVQYTYQQVGIRVPRTAREQFRAGQPVSDVLPGDLLFFRTGNGPEISHVGLYAGQNQMIHAASSSRQVRKVNIQVPYWQQHLAGSVTFLKSTSARPPPPRYSVGVSEPNS